MFVKRPDASLLSLSFGHGPQTLFALGGWIGSGEVWHDLFGQLPHWRCVSLDHRGSGASMHSTSPITIEAMVGASWRRVTPAHFDDFIDWLRKDFDNAINAFATSCVPEANGADQRRWRYQVLRRSTLQSAIELRIMPGLGHVPTLTAPAAVAQLINQRFGNLPMQAAA